ncbi:MAG: hypothetical protein KGY50_02380 [Candidatus Thermoplasmatota archaeon]|nr:hypothetical protein [Candidatus Thermoplasmatota archaeon]
MNTSDTLLHKKGPLKSTLILSLGWMLFIIAWIILFSTSFSVYAHMGVFLLSLLVFIASIIAVWIHWLKTFIPQIGWDFLKTMGLFKQVILTLIIPFMILILIGIYLIFFAHLFSLLQNIVMLFISFLSIIIALSLVWKSADMSPFQFVKQTANPFTSFHKDDESWK